jgi:hypothetical protein
MQQANNTIKTGFKGFNSDWTCNGFQFEVGKTFEHKGKVSLCNSGFHFCENPLDIFSYYPPTGKFAEVEGKNVSSETSGYSQCVCRSITIKSEISLHEVIKLGVELILSKVNFKDAPATNTGDRSAATNTGYSSAATNTGDSSAATNTGDRSAATNTGDSSAATVEGEESVAIVTGKNSKAAGALGCWIVLTERDENWKIVKVKSFKVDGKKIKAGILYALVGGKAVETK